MTLHGRTAKALANHFGGPGSTPRAGCNEREPGCEIFAPERDDALNGCELHITPSFNFNLVPLHVAQYSSKMTCSTQVIYVLLPIYFTE